MKYENKFHKRMEEYIATLPGPTPERTATAKRLFTKIGMDHNSNKQIFEEEVDELNAYADVIDFGTFCEWQDELGANGRGHQFEYGRISVKHAILPPHYQIAHLFLGLVGVQIPGYFDRNTPLNRGWMLKAYGPDQSVWDDVQCSGELSEGKDPPGISKFLHLR
jgi:hypothetical protein